MNGKLRAELEGVLASLSPRERRKLAQRAERDRREARRRVAQVRGRRGLRGPGPQPDDPIEAWMIARLAHERSPEERPVRPTTQREGRVISLTRRWCEVLPDDAEEPVLCALPTALARGQRSLIAVGDRVRFGPRDDDRPEVGEVLPRRTHLSRPDPQDPLARQLLVANVDQVVVVVAAKDPPLRPGLIDRALVGIAQGGARPVLCVNKLDLIDTSEERAALEASLAPYLALDLPVHRVSTKTGEGLDALARRLSTGLSALVGHSGVGKSSLLNALSPTAEAETGAVNAVVGKGRHTTTRSSLHPLPGGGAIIDTPGIRAFGLWRVEPREAAAFFPDLTPLAERCRYRDCLHIDEDPEGCAVQRAAAEGALSPARYAGYRRIVASLQEELDG
ncbi:MAG: ribosome small subunit-dependent GTPase A [Alphaproteobacteria bacterium]|nr:ribosome small subunit-dependent GTPase A [Alphaproteobacteria bacterium]